MNKKGEFIKKTTIGFVGLTIPLLLSTMSAKSYSRSYVPGWEIKMKYWLLSWKE